MKKPLYTFTSVVFLLLFSIFSHAEQPYINVTGIGKAKAVPDIANVQFSFSYRALQQIQAKKHVDTQVINLIKLTEKLGIKKADVHAAQISIYPEYDYKQNRRLIGYRVSRNIKITLRELKNYSALIDGAVKTGATQSGQVTHDFSNRTALENQAMLVALKQAKTKAALLAKEAGAKLGKVLAISESGNTSHPQPLARFQAAENKQAPYPTGELTIVKNLSVKYAIAHE